MTEDKRAMLEAAIKKAEFELFEGPTWVTLGSGHVETLIEAARETLERMGQQHGEPLDTEGRDQTDKKHALEVLRLDMGRRNTDFITPSAYSTICKVLSSSERGAWIPLTQEHNGKLWNLEAVQYGRFQEGSWSAAYPNGINYTILPEGPSNPPIPGKEGAS